MQLSSAHLVGDTRQDAVAFGCHVRSRFRNAYKVRYAELLDIPATSCHWPHAGVTKEPSKRRNLPFLYSIKIQCCVEALLTRLLQREKIGSIVTSSFNIASTLRCRLCASSHQQAEGGTPKCELSSNLPDQILLPRVL